MNSLAIMENVRRYRTIASLYRQTAAFRPVHSCSLLAQAREWEHRAVAELEAYFDAFRSATSGNAASGGCRQRKHQKFVKHDGGAG